MLLRQGAAAAQDIAVPPELLAGPMDQTAFSLLAGDILHDTSLGGTALGFTLWQWLLPPGTRLDGGIGLEGLRYVEEGTIVLTDEGGADTVYQTGSGFLGGVAVRNDTDRCASVLAFGYKIGGRGAAGSTDERGPRLDAPVTCGAAAERRHLVEVLLSDSMMPAPPAFIFMGRKSWSPPPRDGLGSGGSSGAHGHSGPVALIVEAGALQASDGAGTQVILRPGSVIAHPPNLRHTERNIADGPASAFLFGIVSASPDAAPAVPDDYRFVSPTYGFEVAWDLSWSELARGEDSIFLGNGASEVSFMPSTPDLEFADPSAVTPQGCVENGAQSWGAGEPARDEAGRPIAGTGEDSAYALFTDASGLATLIYCAVLVPGETLVEVRWRVGVEDYNAQLPAFERLLGGLKT